MRYKNNTELLRCQAQPDTDEPLAVLFPKALLVHGQVHNAFNERDDRGDGRIDL
jgi:hypothetical protein